MNIWGCTVQDGNIINEKYEFVNISTFAEEFSKLDLITNIKNFGSFHELSDEEIENHYNKIIFEV